MMSVRVEFALFGEQRIESELKRRFDCNVIERAVGVR